MENGLNIPAGASVAVALSGGIDSLMAANELMKRGYGVFGLHARFIDSPDYGPKIAALKKACDFMGIPLHVEDLRENFKAEVVEPFVASYARGLTPNPCALCNPRLKFGLLLDAAMRLGADRIATGHYARTGWWTAPSGQKFATIYPARDKSKDQAYFLALVPGERLQKAVFPLFDKSKDKLRAEAAQMGLPLPEPRESQEICFVPGDDYRAFLKNREVKLPGAGAVCLADGREIGRHAGLWQYTEGQRRGLGIAWAEPLYVIRKNMEDNILVVGTGSELKSGGCRFGGLNLLVPFEFWPEEVFARVRYRQALVAARVRMCGEFAEMEFSAPQDPPAKGQLAVIYHPEGFILGGGVIC